MKELGLAPNDIGSLQKMEWAQAICGWKRGGCEDQSVGTAHGRARGAGNAARGMVTLC